MKWNGFVLGILRYPAIGTCLTGLFLVGVLRLAGASVSHARAASTTDAQGGTGVIAVGENASQLEWFAANEVRRYVYLRTHKLMTVHKGLTGGETVVIGSNKPAIGGDLGRDLGPQQFRLKTAHAGGAKTWWIVGGDALGTLYGAYRFAEKLGVRFGLDEDMVPDELLSKDWPDMDEIARPRFALRGLQPFHDFSVGPDWWNLQDYQSVLSQMAKLRMNYIAFHTYPSWNPSTGPEANVWIGLPEDVDADGNVKFAYEAGVVTTRRGWNVVPCPTGRYACGAGLLFEGDDYGPDFLLGRMDWPKTPDACKAVFNEYGDFQQAAFQYARQLGIKTAVGTEIPLGVPRMLADRLKTLGLDPADPAVIRRLYEGTFLRLKRKMPIDYHWLWIPESWLKDSPGSKGWEMASAVNVEREFSLIEAAARSVRVPFGLATSGWRLGTREDPFWTVKRIPAGWAVTSINTSLGRDPVEKHYGAITDHPKWAIGWAEDDGTAGGNCCTCLDLQLWVRRMFRDSADAFKYGCEGMMAIHWRTAAIAPNISALAQAGWTFEGQGTDRDRSIIAPILLKDADDRVPEVASALSAFWAEWGRGAFGNEAGAEAGRLMQNFDEAHLAINDLYRANTTDERISEVFAPLRELESLRPRITGAASRERYDYWLNMIRATRARAVTWVLHSRLGEKVKQAAAMSDGEAKRRFAREQLLPMRLAVARAHEETISAFMNCAKSPGEVGAIAHIEYGVRDQLVSSLDDEIKRMLGEALPSACNVNTTYCGTPRMFISANCTRMPAGRPQELRPFVLSAVKCEGVTLHWRSLGQGTFQKVIADHRARQAYRVSIPAQSEGAVEYYLEAILENGTKVVWPATAPKANQTAVVW